MLTVQNLVLCASKPRGKNAPFWAEADDQTDTATVVEVPTDEDESEPESEEEFELSEKEQRLLHEAYDTFAATGEQWMQHRQGSSASCRTPFADAGNVREVVDKFIDLPDSWPQTLRLAMAFHRQQTDLGRSSVLRCFTKIVHSYLRPSH